MSIVEPSPNFTDPTMGVSRSANASRLPVDHVVAGGGVHVPHVVMAIPLTAKILDEDNVLGR